MCRGCMGVMPCSLLTITLHILGVQLWLQEPKLFWKIGLENVLLEQPLTSKTVVLNVFRLAASLAGLEALHNCCNLRGISIQKLMYTLQCLPPCRGAGHWGGGSARQEQAWAYNYLLTSSHLDYLRICHCTPQKIWHHSKVPLHPDWETLI